MEHVFRYVHGRTLPSFTRSCSANSGCCPSGARSCNSSPAGSHAVRCRSPRGRGWRRCPSPSATSRQKTVEPPTRASGGPSTVVRLF
ncbi:UNVERIFIED_CONTAM: hypothetical protein Slati_2238500 [Sesamum latifolium]|uniref:Uncharacterized protein n=1 Tax=Sesamum latifolium TaxID=2727402 RepID=A0AAW2WUS5_9LAMI